MRSRTFRRCWWRSKPTGGIALGGRLTVLPQGWARFGVDRDIRVARKRALRLMRENNLLSPHRCTRRGGNPHDGEIITHAPNLMWGTEGVRVFTVDDGWGWIFTAVRALERRVCRLACLQARRRLRRPAADLHGACRAVWLDRGRRGSGAGLADGSRLPVSVGPLHQPDQSVLGHPAVLRLRRRAPDQSASPSGSIARSKEQIIHGRIYRNIAELRDAVRDFVELYNAQWIVEKNGYLSPAQARQAWHALRSQSGPPRETNLCPRNRVRYRLSDVRNAHWTPIAANEFRFDLR